MINNSKLVKSPAGVDVARMGLQEQFRKISHELTRSIADLNTLFTSNVRDVVQAPVVYQR